MKYLYIAIQIWTIHIVLPQRVLLYFWREEAVTQVFLQNGFHQIIAWWLFMDFFCWVSMAPAKKQKKKTQNPFKQIIL